MATEHNFRTVHKTATVVDGHSDIFTDIVFRRGRGEHEVFAKQHLPQLRDGGVNLVLSAAYIEPEYKPERALKRAMQILGAALADLDETPDAARVVRTKEDLRQVVSDSALGLILGIEGAEPVEDSTESVRAFYEIGVRFLGLTWNQRNRLADGVDEERSKGGLTEAGVATVLEANRLGIMIDVSHLSQAGFWDVLEVSQQPIMASHSSSRALLNHPRNLSDEQVVALAQKGGVVGVCFAGPHLAESGANVESIVDHVDHYVQLVGAEHVGLGPDFTKYLYQGGGLPEPPGGYRSHLTKDMEDATDLPRLTESLVKRGYSTSQIESVLGMSFVRLFESVLR